MPPNVTFPPPLLDAYRTGKLAVLFGSGLSIAADVEPRFPRWRELPGLLLDAAGKHGALPKEIIDNKRSIFQHPDLSLEGMLEELDTVVGALRRIRRYQAALTAIFRPSKLAPGDVHRALVDLDLAILATTNYDALLEHAERPGERTPYTWKDADNALADIDAGRKVLFKMHGSAENDESVVMTRREYDGISRDESYKRIVGHLLQTYTFLLVGYGINDPLDLDLVFDFNVKAFGSATRPHYALVRRPEAAPHKDRWAREMSIHVVEYDDHGDLPAILRALAAAAKPGPPPAGRP